MFHKLIASLIALFNSIPLVKRINDDRAYFELRKAGFLITKSYSKEMGTTMYRFWWNGKILPQHGDITNLTEGRWSSMLNGSSVRLDKLERDTWVMTWYKPLAREMFDREDLLSPGEAVDLVGSHMRNNLQKALDEEIDRLR